MLKVNLEKEVLSHLQYRSVCETIEYVWSEDIERISE
ncbi:hypothetical protein SAMN04488696_0769 [Methanolobus profundi]|uniref:Uncharacterized protein n=1 Tax=Methanolobus profundi TaxID=487685 RepID=A0A1I4PMK5_9EURY|nr:hypothetical protein SAMN04488696_0769 [Methanolobus profundi]